jgi:glucose uptake protein GlcU
MVMSIRRACKIICNVLVACATLASAALWSLSAVAENKAHALPVSHNSELIRTYLVLSAKFNDWAAICALIAGIALFLTLSLRDAGNAG